MIPLTLQLKNFLSYGPQTQIINFSDHHLICLSGKNGHGKSALLDALTWAIWGQARKMPGASKADEGLLHLGQTQMMVSLDFVCGGQQYRVRREYAKNYGKAYAALDFGIIKEDGNTVSLTEKTIRKTQEKIEHTLHLDFESFANSAFLRQGHANEFSKKSPKDRKEVLGTILGLNQYEALRKAASDRAKQVQAEKLTLVKFQEKIEAELEKSTQIKIDLATLHKQLANSTQQEKELQKQLKKLAKSKDALTQKKQAYEMLKLELEQNKQQEERLLTELRTLRTTWRTLHKKQLQLPDITKLETERAKLATQLQEQQQKLQKNLALKEAYLKQKEALHALEQHLKTAQLTQTQNKKLVVERLTVELKATETELHKLQQQHQELLARVAQQAQKLQESTQPKPVDQDVFAAQEKQFNKRKEFYQKYVAQGNMLSSETASIAHKMKLADQPDNPSCSLCEQNLSASRKRFLQAKFTQQHAVTLHRLSRIKRLISNLKEVLIDQHATLTKMRTALEEQRVAAAKREEQLKAQQALEVTATNLAKEITAKEKTTAQLKKKQAQAQQELLRCTKEQEQEYKENKEYSALKNKLEKLTKDARELNYSTKQHQLIAEQFKTIDQQYTQFIQLKEQLSGQRKRQEEVHNICMQIKKLRTTQQKLEDKQAGVKKALTQEKTLRAQEQELLSTQKSILKEKGRYLELKGSLSQQQEHLRTLEKEHRAHQKTIANFNNEIEEYQAIATAASKDGIQALLIEEAIPEIEHEANALLARLTDNQAQVQIESLRDLKKGGSKETLDIKISDAAGIRPYELFSGGEAFRIDFALRIAISKLLARRAGTSLQTLIIDEGFGSQDEEGLSYIMDAIYKIQGDFSKVIIVSHLTSMKNQFPVHFVVQKAAGGSTVNVFEQG